MKTDDLDILWQSPLNQPSPAQLNTQAMQFLRELQCRRRGTAIFLGWILTLLSVITGWVMYGFFGPGRDGGGMEIRREWAALLLLALPWGCLAVFYRNHRRHREEHPAYDRSIRASLRALLDENRMARRRRKGVMLLWLLTILVVPVMVSPLRTSGKAGDEILIPAFMLLPLLMAGVFLGMFLHDRWILRPREQHLRQLLADYGEVEPAAP